MSSVTSAARTLRILLPALLVAVVGGAVLWTPSAGGQPSHGQTSHHGQVGHGQTNQGHGQAGHGVDADSHFAAVAEHLELTADQRETLKETFVEAIEAMTTLHRLHATLATALTEEQREKLSERLHARVCMASQEPLHGGHSRHH